MSMKVCSWIYKKNSTTCHFFCPSFLRCDLDLIQPFHNTIHEVVQGQILQSWVPKIGWENDPMRFRRKRQFAATPLRPTFGSPYHSSKTLNHGGPLNVIITEWFDTNSNETHCWIKCKKIKNEKKALKNSYKMVSFGSTIDGVRMIRCAPIEIFLTRGGIPGDPTPRWFLHCAPQGRPQIAICARPYWILYNIYIYIYIGPPNPRHLWAPHCGARLEPHQSRRRYVIERLRCYLSVCKISSQSDHSISNIDPWPSSLRIF